MSTAAGNEKTSPNKRTGEGSVFVPGVYMPSCQATRRGGRPWPALPLPGLPAGARQGISPRARARRSLGRRGANSAGEYRLINTAVSNRSHPSSLPRRARSADPGRRRVRTPALARRLGAAPRALGRPWPPTARAMCHSLVSLAS